jgi:hypothetical protein
VFRSLMVEIHRDVAVPVFFTVAKAEQRDLCTKSQPFARCKTPVLTVGYDDFLFDCQGF